MRSDKLYDTFKNDRLNSTLQLKWLDIQGVLEVSTQLIFCVCTHSISYGNTYLTFRIKPPKMPAEVD